MRVLVTGAAGFIGSSISKRLVEDGHTVLGVDNLSTGKLENISSIRKEMHFRTGDIRDASLMQNLCGDIDVVFHQAALPSVPKSVLDPLTSHLHNVDGTLNVLLAARENGVRRIIYAASSSAYGDSLTLPKHEGMLPAPISPYAVQKLAAEHYMQSFTRVYGIETVSLRYFNVFGPFQAADSPYSGVLAKFITSMLNGQAPAIYGDGSQSRDFTYIDNVVSANLLAATALAERVSGNVYNIACAERYSLLDTYKILAELVGFRGDPTFAPARNGDILHSLASIDRAKQDLGYAPSVGFVEGLRRTVEWYAGKSQQGNRFPAAASLLSAANS